MTGAGAPCGVLVVDKPTGMTSAAVVALVKRRLGGAKVGHTGTLDPMATGVLPLVVGQATKIAGFILANEKSYSGTIELGAETDTLDCDGQVTTEDRAAAAGLSCTAIAAAAADLCGVIQQVPPMYSALKHKGRRLHQLAREGKVVERPPREVTVKRFEIPRCEPPHIDFDIACSSGTYVRALARDLGRALGVGAHLVKLRRTSVGAFDLSMARELDSLTAASIAQDLIAPARALDPMPRVEVTDELCQRVRTGLRFEVGRLSSVPDEGVIFQMVDSSGQLLALARNDQGRVRYERVFTMATTDELSG